MRIPSRVKLVLLILTTLALTYSLLASDPTGLLRLIPSETGRSLYHTLPDKVLHFGAYTFFAFVLVWYGASSAWGVIGLLVGLALVHAMGTEYLQRFVPERTSDFGDLLADFLGVGLGTCVGVLVTGLRRGDPEPVGIGLGGRMCLASPGKTQTELAIAGRTTAGMGARYCPEDSKSLPPARVLNYRYLTILSVASCVVLTSVYVVHGVQVRRNAGDLLELGRRARENGNVEAATQYYGRYLGLTPDDINALADYGQLLDERAGTRRAGSRVFMVYEEVLRRNPTRDDIRRRLVEVALDIGRPSDALAHLKVLRQTDPEDGSLHCQAGRCLEQLADWQAAADAYDLAIDHGTGQVEAWDRLARLCQDRLDRPARAEQLMDELVARNQQSVAAYLARAKYHQQYGDLENASNDVNQALQLAPHNCEVILTAGQVAFDRAAAAQTASRTQPRNRIVAEARRLLKQGTQQYPEDAEFCLLLAQLESHFGNRGDAVGWLERTLELIPNDPRALMALADVLIEQGEYDRARGAIDRLPRNSRVDAFRFYLEARVLMAEKEWPHAIETLGNARRFSAESPAIVQRVDLALALCHERLDDHEAKATAYRRVLKSDTTSVPARLGLAAAALQTGRVPEAIAEYRQLCHLPKARLSLVRLLIVQNLRLPDLARNWHEVSDLLDQAEEQGDDPVHTALLRAELEAAQGRIEAARKVIEDARVTLTDRVEFWIALSQLADQAGQRLQASLWLGQAYQIMGDSEEAEQHLKQAVTLAGTNPAPHIIYLQFLRRNGRQQEADDLLEELLNGRTANERTTVLAEFHAAAGHWEQAGTEYRKALAKNAQDPVALRGLAQLHLRRDWTNAEPFLRRIVSLPEVLSSCDLPWARRNLAVILAAKGDYATYQQALGLLQDNSKQAVERIADQRARATVLASRPDAVDRQEAIRILEELADGDQLLNKDHWLLGRLYSQAERWAEADSQFQAVLAESDDHPMYLAEYTDNLIRRKAFDRAATWRKRLEELEPNSYRTLQLTTRLWAGQGKTGLACKRLAEFINGTAGEIDNEARRISLAAVLADQLAQAVRSAGDADAAKELESQAEALYRRDTEQNPSHATLFLSFLLRTGHVDEAFALCQKAWKEYPAEVAADVTLALAATGQVSESQLKGLETQWDQALQQPSRSIAFQAKRADFHCLRSQFGQAEDLYRLVLQTEPHRISALNNLAWLLALQEKDLQDAKDLIDRAIRVAGPARQLLDTRACVYLAMERPDRAIQDLDVFTAGDPTANECIHLALAHALAGNGPEAEAALKRAKTLGFEPATLHPLERRQFERIHVLLATL